jgi:hypothetical protein
MDTDGHGYFIGVDLGQRQDYTAVSVVERSGEELGRDRVTWGMRTARRFDLRYLERLPLGTEYGAAVERVREVTERLRGAGAAASVAVDATGVGWPVVEMLRGAGLRCEVTAVVITGGERESRGPGLVRVPKRDLVTGLQVVMETGEFRMAAGMKEGAALVKELAGMRVKVSGAGNETWGAWREGTHDDLVLSVALACWRARRREARESGEGRLV